MSDKLAEIIAHKRKEVAARKTVRIARELALIARETPQPRGFARALDAAAENGFALIAEVKKASPSKGVIREDFYPRGAAEAYAQAGAACLSVLTDERFFQGHDDYLRVARDAVSLPALRKDFTIDEYQLHEARVIGADAILLIVALMDSSQLDDYIGWAGELGLSVLVEIHDGEELTQAKAAGAELIGVNNRDLKTFETTLETTFELLPEMPEGAVVVSESGIEHREDVERLEEAGIGAILVGESLMREKDIGAKVREILGT